MKVSKLLLAGIFALSACMNLHTLKAEESVTARGDAGNTACDERICNDNTPIVDSNPDSCFVSSARNTAEENISGYSYIYVSGNELVYDKNHLITEHNTANDIQKPKAKAKSNKAVSYATNIATDNQEEHKTIVLPALPLSSSPTSFLYVSKESTGTVSKQRNKGYQSKKKSCREDVFQHAEQVDLFLYLPEQRQKLSITATQCGILTSFSTHSPTSV